MIKIDEEQFFNEFLDTNYERIRIFQRYEYQVSKVIKLIDPVLYRTTLLDYIDHMKKAGFIIEENGELYFVDTK